VFGCGVCAFYWRSFWQTFPCYVWDYDTCAMWALEYCRWWVRTGRRCGELNHYQTWIRRKFRYFRVGCQFSNHWSCSGTQGTPREDFVVYRVKAGSREFWIKILWIGVRRFLLRTLEEPDFTRRKEVAQILASGIFWLSWNTLVDKDLRDISLCEIHANFCARSLRQSVFWRCIAIVCPSGNV